MARRLAALLLLLTLSLGANYAAAKATATPLPPRQLVSPPLSPHLELLQLRGAREFLHGWALPVILS